MRSCRIHSNYSSVLVKLAICFITFSQFSCQSNQDQFRTWEVYKGGPEANNYSALNQVNKSNVKNLSVAWEFYPEDEPEGFRIWKYECNPIVIGNVMYIVSAWRHIYALNATTGEEIWSFDPLNGKRGGGVLRGVTYWKDEKSVEERIFFSARSRLFSIDAKTGLPDETFGENGSVDLRASLENKDGSKVVRLSTPGIIFKNLIIVGSVVSESSGAAPGLIRAYDVVSGRLAWTFHTIPRPGAFGHDTWPEEAYLYAGGANNWAGMSLDIERGIVYVPTGSPTYDYYGADRIGANLFGNCLIALDAETGKYIWHFQSVHHDIWDYDLPTAPNLVSFTIGDREVDAVVQPTKMGFLYVLDRETGKPLYPIEEREVISSNIPGESSWPTQPFPLKPAPFARQTITESDIFTRDNEPNEAKLQIVRNLYAKGIFTPLDSTTSVMFPGSRGGAEWGGASFDHQTGILYINSNELPELGRIEKVYQIDFEGESLYSAGKKVYETRCESCHGGDKHGMDVMPSLVGLGDRMSALEIIDILNRGSGVMPSFANLPQESLNSVVAFLLNTGKNTPISSSQVQDTSFSYLNVANKEILNYTDGSPMVKPPWGTLNAIDLNTAEYVWKVPLGNRPEFQKPGAPDTGMENYGGPVVTAGGLVFIAASMDRKFRAFDKDTGDKLWEYQLPGNGLANPAIFEVDGSQYISIAVSIGENFNHEKSGIITFHLPN